MWRKIVQSTYRRKERRARDPQDSYRRVVGDLAWFWSVIDGNLTTWIEDIHANGGAKAIQSHLPANLDRKLDYLSAAFRKNLIPDQYVCEGRRIVQEVHNLKTFRHTLIHGVLVEISDDGRTIVDHSRVRGAAVIRARTVYSWTQIGRHYNRSWDVAAELADYLTVMLEEDENASG